MWEVSWAGPSRSDVVSDTGLVGDAGLEGRLRDAFGRGPREVGDELDVARHLEAGELLGDPLRDLLGGRPIGRHTSRQLDEGLDLFAECFVRFGDDGSRDHEVVAFEGGFHLDPRDVLTTASPQALDPSAQLRAVGGGTDDEVAGVEPAVA